MHSVCCDLLFCLISLLVGCLGKSLKAMAICYPFLEVSLYAWHIGPFRDCLAVATQNKASTAQPPLAQWCLRPLFSANPPSVLSLGLAFSTNLSPNFFFFFGFCIPCSCLRWEFLYPPPMQGTPALVPQCVQNFAVAPLCLSSKQNEALLRTRGPKMGCDTCAVFCEVFVEQHKRKGNLLPHNKVLIDSFCFFFIFWPHSIKGFWGHWNKDYSPKCVCKKWF